MSEFEDVNHLSTPERLDVRVWHKKLALRSPETHLARKDGTAHDRVARFRGIDPCIEQPPLRENVLAIHLGGAKRVTRSHGLNREEFQVEEGSATLMPACESFRWQTKGPVDFAHLILDDDFIPTAAEDYDRDHQQVRLRSAVGLTDPLLLAIARSLLAELEHQRPSKLYCDSLLGTLGCHLVRHYNDSWSQNNAIAAPWRSKGGLAGWQLRRVLDYMHANLSRNVELAELVELTGLSRSQFFHAFSRSMGCSPYRSLTKLRVRQATSLLSDTDLPIGEIAAAVGLSQSQLVSSFRRCIGTSPRGYRREQARFGSSRIQETP